MFEVVSYELENAECLYGSMTYVRGGAEGLSVEIIGRNALP
jgi:hypothetical protein